MKKYFELLKELLDYGNQKIDKLSLFGKSIEFELNDEFPVLLSTKETFLDSQFIQENTVQIQELVYTLLTNPDDQYNLFRSSGDVEFELYSCEMKYLERVSMFKQYAIDQALDVTGLSNDDAMEHYNFPKRKLSLCYKYTDIEFLKHCFNSITFFALLTHMIAQLSNHHVDRLIGEFGEIFINLIDVEEGLEFVKITPEKPHKLILNRSVKNLTDFKDSDFKIV
jgi:thymidylate synthase